MYLIFTHLKSWVAVARHNFKWVKIYSASPASFPPSAYCLCLWRLCRLIVVPWLCFQIKTLPYTKTCRNCAIIVVSIIMTIDLITVEIQVQKHKITCTPIMTIAHNSQTNKGNKIGTGCWWYSLHARLKLRYRWGHLVTGDWTGSETQSLKKETYYFLWQHETSGWAPSMPAHYKHNRHLNCMRAWFSVSTKPKHANRWLFFHHGWCGNCRYLTLIIWSINYTNTLSNYVMYSGQTQQNIKKKSRCTYNYIRYERLRTSIVIAEGTRRGGGEGLQSQNTVTAYLSNKLFLKAVTTFGVCTTL